MNKVITGFFMAWGNFSQIPCPIKRWDEDARKWMVALMPAVGISCGLLQLATFYVLKIIENFGGEVFAQPFQAALLTMAPLLVCGFIHLDGYMDVSDAVLSRRDLQRRREILKDSSIGAFAVIMVVFFFMTYYGAMLAILFSQNVEEKMWSLVLVPVIARALSSRDVLIRKPMEVSQYAQMDRKKGAECYIGVIAAVAVTAFLTAFIFNIYGEWKYPVAAAAGTILGQGFASYFARRNLQGMNGDIAGFSIVVGELAGIAVCCII